MAGAKENLAGYLGKATRHGREVISRIASPEPFVVVASTSPDETWQGATDDHLAEIIIIANANNGDAVQFSIFGAVAADNYIDLWAKDSTSLGGLKLSDIHFKFAEAGLSVHLAYTLADGELVDLEDV